MSDVSPTDRARAAHAWHTFARGARVFDSISGQDGTVLAAAISHHTTPASSPATGATPSGLFQLPDAFVSETVTVRLDDGATVSRDPSDLVELPAGVDELPADLAPIRGDDQ